MALTDAAAVKAYLAETGNGIDAIIAALIPAVEARILSHLGRARIESGAVTDERHSGTGRPGPVLLREWPASAVSSVALSGEALDLADVELDGDEGQLWYKPGGSYAAWPSGLRNVVVSYTAGYDTVPADLAQAATIQVAWDLKRTGHKGGRLGERQTFVAGEGASAIYLVDPWAPEVLAVLDRYRRVSI